MMQAEHTVHCPVCEAVRWKRVFDVNDHSISKETFTIIECDNCSLRYTSGAPASDQIARYYKSENYISHTNTSKGVINLVYQWVRKFMLGKKRKLITQVATISTGTLLDYGSGAGAFLAHMKKAGWNATGVEPDADARSTAHRDFGVELLKPTDLNNLSAAQFDVITLWHVVEHIHALDKTIAQLKLLLKPQGVILIAVPNYTSLDAYHFGPYWAAYDVPRHLYHFSPHSMDVLMQKHGLKVVDKKALWFDSFYVSLLSTRYQKGKTDYADGLWQGIRSTRETMRAVDRCSSLIYVITQ